jgi:hypothetical protein
MRGNTEIINVFVNRLKKIGIKVGLAVNYPWIYIDKINGKTITDKFQGNHGFTIAFYLLNGRIGFTSLKEIFRLIRELR